MSRLTKCRFLFVLMACSSILMVHAQTQQAPSRPPKRTEKEQQMLDSLRQKMRKDHEAINRLLNGGLFSNLNPDFYERFQKLFENYYQGSMDNFFDDQKFDQFFKQWAPHNYLEEGDGHWMETTNERILILKLDLPKDSPLDIKIEKGIINISGKVMRQRVSPQGEKLDEEMQFQKVFPIPSDCDGSKAKFENDDGKIKIRLPKQSHQIKQVTPKKGDLRL